MQKPIIFTKRLKLRLVELSDTAAIHEIHSFPEVDYFNTLGIPENMEDSIKVVRQTVNAHEQPEIKNYCFAVEDQETNSFSGMVAIHLGSPKYKSGEIWYKFHPKHWGKGYATEASLGLLQFGFETLDLHRIEAGCAVDHKASIRVMEKLGMTREGLFRKALPLKTGWSDNYMYAILKEEFKQ